jgi:hypothetical protein
MADSPNMLNLDDITVDIKTVVFKNERHDSKSLTVEDYLAKLKQAAAIKSAEQTAETKVEQSIQFLSEMFPSFPKDELKQLPLKKLTAFITFAMAPAKDIAEGVDRASASTESPND